MASLFPLRAGRKLLQEKEEREPVVLVPSVAQWYINNSYIQNNKINISWVFKIQE